MNKEGNKKQFIERAKLIHGDKYDYSKVNYMNAHTNVEIICKIHGSFFQSPHNHLKKGCKLCGIKSAQELRSKGNENFIKFAKITHGDKYDYSEVNYINKRTNVKIKCIKCDIIFEQTPEVHLRGSGCQTCRIFKINKNPNKIIVVDDMMNNEIKSKTEQFIKKAKLIHGDKYGYDDSDYVNSYTKLKIKCSTHGIFEQTPSNHLVGRGCEKCGHQIANDKQRFSTADFIEKAIAIHGDKYDYSKVNYVNYGTNVEIICPIHGSFFQTPSNHLSYKAGCIKCRDVSNGDNKRDTLEEFIEKANKVHNNKFDYSKVVYVNGRTKVEIICPTHGSFWQTPKSHIQCIGCDKCAKRSFSIKAIAWLDCIAKKENIVIQHAMNSGEYKLPNTDINMKVDGFCVETNTVFEFFGTFWHSHPNYYNPLKIHPVNKQTFGDIYIKTLERIIAIQKLGYKLVTIWEHDWDTINKLSLLNDKISDN